MRSMGVHMSGRRARAAGRLCVRSTASWPAFSHVKYKPSALDPRRAARPAGQSRQLRRPRHAGLPHHAGADSAARYELAVARHRASRVYSERLRLSEAVGGDGGPRRARSSPRRRFGAFASAVAAGRRRCAAQRAVSTVLSLLSRHSGALLVRAAAATGARRPPFRRSTLPLFQLIWALVAGFRPVSCK